MTISQPKVFVAITPKLYARLFPPSTDHTLRELSQATFHDQPRDLTSAELAKVIRGYDAIITGWGTPAFDRNVLSAAAGLRLVAHSAGSIKHLLPPELFAKGVRVTHAAGAIAPAVAEMSLTLTLTLLRRVPQFHAALHKGKSWQDAVDTGTGRELAGTRVGVIGAGYTGRCFIRLLRLLDAEVQVYDPFLTDQRAAELGAKRMPLAELLAGCPVISLQAPSTPETHHMIGVKELALLQDGAIFINTARSWLVDEQALLAELKTGRISAALDVFDTEPLPADSPFRSLPNVIVTPHVAGLSVQSAHRQGQVVVEELVRYFSGQPLRFAVTADMLGSIA